VLRTDIPAMNAGQSLNPEMISPIRGRPFIQGNGWLTTEELVY